MIEIQCNTYDLKETLYSGQAFRWIELSQCLEQNITVHQSVISGHRVNLWESVGTIYASCPTLDNRQLKELSYSYLRLDDDMSRIYQTFDSDQYISTAISKYKGLHILRQDPWECLVTFICSANNNIPRIRQLVDKLCENCGEMKIDSKGKYYCFPSPAQIAEFGESNLRKLGLGFRAKYVYGSSVRLLTEDIDLFKFRNESYQQSLDMLIGFPGVGDKVANCVLLFSMDKLDAFPVDVWIKRVLRESYLSGSKEKVTDSRLREWAQSKFGIYAGYANQYLFHRRRLD